MPKRQRHQAQRRHRRRHQDGNQPFLRAAQDGLRLPGRAFDFHQMLVMRQKQDGVAGADAEHRDQPHHGAQRQAAANEAMAATLPIRLKGRLTSTSQVLARQLKADEQDHADQDQRESRCKAASASAAACCAAAAPLNST